MLPMEVFKITCNIAYGLLSGPVWAVVLEWCLRNFAVNRIAAEHLSDPCQQEMFANKMQIALFSTVGGIVCFILGVILLILSGEKQVDSCPEKCIKGPCHS